MSSTPTDTPSTYFAPLQGEEFIVLTSYRRDGTPVPTTVWFAEVDDVLYITTNRSLGKVKRISANPRVQVAPSDRVGQVHGDWLEAQARLLGPQEAEAASQALVAKYGQQYIAMTGQMDARMPPGSRVFLAVSRPAA